MSANPRVSRRLFRWVEYLMSIVSMVEGTLATGADSKDFEL